MRKPQSDSQSGKGNTYGGVRLYCQKCGIVKLTVDELRTLVDAKLESRRCLKCGTAADFV